jgi:hypothetical protein
MIGRRGGTDQSSKRRGKAAAGIFESADAEEKFGNPLASGVVSGSTFEVDDGKFAKEEVVPPFATTASGGGHPREDNIGRSQGRRKLKTFSLRERLGKLRAVLSDSSDDEDVDPRTERANALAKRLFLVLDFKHDHSLTERELKVGLGMIQTVWARMVDVYPCSAAKFANGRVYGGDAAAQLVMKLNGLEHSALLSFAFRAGVDPLACSIGDDEVADLILDAEGCHRAQLRKELETATDMMLRSRGLAAGFHTSKPRLPRAGVIEASDEAWIVLTAGTVYIAGIEGELEKDGQLERLMAAAFGPVAAHEVRVRARPQKSWALLTFEDSTSHDAALDTANPAVSKLVSEHGISITAVDHTKARSSTGAFGDVWRRCRSAVSNASVARVARQSWRRQLIDSLVALEPRQTLLAQLEQEVREDVGLVSLQNHLKAVQSSQDPQYIVRNAQAAPSDVESGIRSSTKQERKEAAKQARKSAKKAKKSKGTEVADSAANDDGKDADPNRAVTFDVETGTYGSLRALALQHVDTQSAICDMLGKKQCAVRAELQGLSHQQLMTRARKLTDVRSVKLLEAVGAHGRGLGREKLIRLVWHAELRCHMRQRLFDIEQKSKHHKLRTRANNCGIKALQVAKSSEELIELILDHILPDLCNPQDISSCLLPCLTAVAKTVGGKLPNNVHFIKSVQDVLQDDPDAVIAPLSSDWAVENADQHPCFDRMLKLLTDPYLEHIVLPQIEHWFRIFSVVDLTRDGTTPFVELERGLQMACAPDIDIMQTSAMVSETVLSLKFAIRQREIVDQVLGLCFDDADAALESQRYCTVSQICRRLSDATYHCKELMSIKFNRLLNAADTAGHAALEGLHLPHLDAAVYKLCGAARALANAICDTLRSQAAHLHRNSPLLLQLSAFKYALLKQIVPMCNRIMDSHATLYATDVLEGATRPQDNPALHRVVARYLLRRRLKLLAAVGVWVSRSAPGQCPLEKLQARVRGVIERRRTMKTFSDKPAHDVDAATEDGSLADLKYLDWVDVLLNVLRNQSVSAREHIVKQFLTWLRCAQDPQSSDTDDEPSGLCFPAILLYRETMDDKLSLLTQIRNRWLEMLLVLDRNNSGTLTPMDMRTCFMAFSDMGVIAEQEDMLPQNSNYNDFRIPVDHFLGFKTKKKQLGWKTRDGQQPYECNCVQAGALMDNFPVYVAPGECVLTGHEGVRIAGHPFAIELQFQFDVSDPAAWESHKYNVLVTSYVQNAIVARLCGSIQQPGIRLLFIPNEAFEEASLAMRRCQQLESEGCDDSGADSAYPTNKGTFVLTPFIPMQQLQWYRLEIHGEKLITVSTTEEQLVLRVRVDPLNHDTREIEPDEDSAPMYDEDGQYIVDDATKERWSDGRPSAKLINRPAPKRSKKQHQASQQNAIKPWFQTSWTGPGKLVDVYGIGNVFDHVCTDASGQFNWNLGAMCNIKVFAMQRMWLRENVYMWPNIVPDNRNISIRSPQKGSPRSSQSVLDMPVLPDLRYYLDCATRDPDRRVFGSAGRRRRNLHAWVVKGLYHLCAELNESERELLQWQWSRYNPFNDDCLLYSDWTLRCLMFDFCQWTVLINAIKRRLAIGYSYPLWSKLTNDWNEDYEPAFPFANCVINRRNAIFLARKSSRTTDLIREYLKAIPTKENQQFWELSDTLKLDSGILGMIQAAFIKTDAGLNAMCSGLQMKETMRRMQRNRRLNKDKCRAVTKFLLLPIGYARRHLRHKKRMLSGSVYEMHAAENLVHYLLKTTGKSPANRVIGGIMLVWSLLVYLLVGCLVLRISALHEMEAIVALVYYIWAGIIVGLEVGDEVMKLPTDTPFALAYRKAEISTMALTMTRIGNGQQITTTIMGFVQMIIRMHKSEDDDDEEEEEEDEEEEQDPFQIKRKTLQKLWTQGELQEALPFAEPGVTAAEVIYDYEVETNRPVESAADWEDKQDVYMNSMNTSLDLGHPTEKGKQIIMGLSIANATIGLVQRAVMVLLGTPGVIIIGPIFGEGSVVLACVAVTFVSSYVVYNSMFRVTFMWYLTSSNQLLFLYYACELTGISPSALCVFITESSFPEQVSSPSIRRTDVQIAYDSNSEKELPPMLL